MGIREACIILHCLTVTLVAGLEGGSGAGGREDRQDIAFEAMVPVRDGSLMHVVGSHPKCHRACKFPTLLTVTPYNASKAWAKAIESADPEFAVVVQRQRSTGRSTGDPTGRYTGTPDDIYDVIQWICDKWWSSGKVFITGSSASGISGSLAQVKGKSHPALQALSLSVYSYSPYDVAFENGLLTYQTSIEWNKKNAPERVEFILTHERYVPNLHGAMDVSYESWGHTTLPVIHAGGWHGPFSQLVVQAYQGQQTEGGRGAKGNQFLVMGFGDHCGPRKTQIPYPGSLAQGPVRRILQNNLFAHILEGKSMSSFNLPRLYLSVLGNPRFRQVSVKQNFWVCLDEWPVPTIRRFRLSRGVLERSAGMLADEAWEGLGNASLSTTFTSDPTSPVPTLGGHALGYESCGPWDQRLLEQRSDVIRFTSSRLDSDLAIVGLVTFDLYVSTTQTDGDIMVKLTDVNDDGESFNVADSGMRLRRRNGSESASEPVVPGLVYRVEIELYASYVFRKNHQVRLVVAGSNAPQYSVNLQNIECGIESCPPPHEPQTANVSIHHSNEYPSTITLPTVALTRLQEQKCDPVRTIQQG
eukprot:CAMPEP_0119123344 /NCGR_PEP_ID=MMETSP1310-20130426/3314_1 /TAXON_ID=464262 /ORGANISM="Genus nov. species nov., Strain RCC2339" /LENGTH=584 /DNA_ID=CAMNT_0007113137 /DNA_START=55 /DNA_END=1809 /DNA_ORIENTATION=+